MIRTSLFAAATVAAIGSIALAQSGAMEEPKKEEVKPLTIGDPARPIEIAHWIKGEPIKSFEDGKVYVLEFWATWCGPCRASMPHITKVQEQYRDYDVTIIGISDEELATVVKFLCSKDGDTLWFDKIGYTLATDPDRSVYRDYMTAAAQRGIPTAFIIGKDQRLEWVGHPMNIDKPLEQVVRGEWNRNAFKDKWEADQLVNREMQRVQTELRTAMREENWDKALSILDDLIAKAPNSFGPMMQKFTTLLVPMNQPERAYAFGETMAEANWDNAMALNQLAWYVVDSPGVKTRNLDFAYRVAQRANELTQSKDAAILDTLARVYYEKGDLKNAVKYQKQAVEHAPDGPMGQEIAEVLKKYEEELVGKSKP